MKNNDTSYFVLTYSKKHWMAVIENDYQETKGTRYVKA